MSRRALLSAELRQLGTLAVPLALSQLGHQLMTVVDTAMLGRYDDAALAGAGIAGGILLALSVIGMGTIMGLDTLIPQALGGGRFARAYALYRSGARLALVLAVPLCLAAAAASWLLPYSPLEDAVADESAIYLLGRIPGIPAFLLFTAMRSYVQAQRSTRPLVIAMLVGNLVNLVADWVFIFGDDGLVQIGLPAIGLPAMGAAGAALSSSIVAWCYTLVGAWAIRLMERPVQDEVELGERPWVAIIRLGLPVGLQLLAEVGIFALTGFLAGTMGQVPAAAHQVALALASFSFSSAVGIASATSVQVGRAIGAGDGPGARRAGWTGIGVGAALMGTAGVAFLIIPEPLAYLVTDDPVVVAAAVPLLRVAALFQLTDALQAVAAGALRGAGDTRSTFYGNLFGHYALGVPVAIGLGFGADWGAIGLWWGLSAGLTATAIVLAVRFQRVTRGSVAAA